MIFARPAAFAAHDADSLRPRGACVHPVRSMHLSLSGYVCEYVNELHAQHD